ncbi:serine/threonine-protein kinase Nek11-like isoform X2 [Xenia sp. Carnegie-2017]|uniref:serine/threonine-protein kinase Nek11-like isoform X2 n=1 Tax=Xenia sp. Carnegie-2017 TaxID=2897299 RepID=UPI001F0345E2|nr:serine/threonine-protein kinase Nek11-like isoform X2 [Xenia sp. Carnegie-2017]
MRHLMRKGKLICCQSFVYMESFCIITEFCEGGDLNDKINSWKKAGRTFDQSLVLAWFVQLLLAIQFIHKKRILHRDIKTRNIFLKNNMIKIGDFGISRILMGTSDMATTFTGTAYYMSPEILRHEGYNSKSDIWSLGVVLYEICTLSRAFEGKNLLGVMYKIVEGEAPQLPDTFEPKLRSIFESMLSKNPVQRPSVSEILTNPYISTLVKDIKRKMEESNRSNFVESGSTKSRNVDHTPHFSPLKRPMTPLEKMRLRKQERADAQAERLKQVTAQKYAESRRKYSNVKRKQSLSSVGLPWVKEHPDVFHNIPDYPETDAECSGSTACQFGTRDVSLINSSSDSGLFPSDHEEEPGSEFDHELKTEGLHDDTSELTLTNVSTIPEDDLEAETYYSQFDNEFEDYEDSGGSEGSDEDEDEHNAFIDQLQAVLELDAQETMEDETIEERFTLISRQQKVVQLRRECIKVFGEKTFLDVYRYLTEIRFNSEEKVDEQLIFEGLRKFVAHPTDCFLVDQLLFLEKQMEISASI